MRLYLISQSVNNDYDTYDAVVVAAKSPQDARKIHPCSFVTHVSKGKWMGTYSGGPNPGLEYTRRTGDWVRYTDRDSIEVQYLGETKLERGVILSSFNAG